jgi:hypothetical protein
LNNGEIVKLLKIKELLLISLTGIVVVSCNSGGSTDGTPYTNYNYANDAIACAQNQGSLVVGAVIKTPYSVNGTVSQGINQSHTHIYVEAQNDNNTIYDISASNVYAYGYESTNANIVPVPLTSISTGTFVEACGVVFTDNLKSPATKGLHYVHVVTTPLQTGQANGWVKIITSDTSITANLESSTKYSYLYDN